MKNLLLPPPPTHKHLLFALLLGLSVVFVPSCMMEDIAPEEPVLVLDASGDRSIRSMAYDDTQDILDELMNDGASLRKIDGKLLTAFGALSQEEVKHMRKKGVEKERLSYFIESESGGSVFNYIVDIQRGARPYAWIIEYELQEGDWDFERFSSFTGWIRYYDAKGELHLENKMEKGQVAEARFARTSSTICFNEWYEYGHTEVTSPAGTIAKDFWVDPRMEITTCDKEEEPTKVDGKTMDFLGPTRLDASPGTSLNLPNRRDLKLEKLTNPCARGIVIALIGQNSPMRDGWFPFADHSIANFILNLFDSSSKFDLYISNEEFISGDEKPDELKTAITRPKRFNQETGKIELEIVLSTSYLQSATRLSIARTIIHELVHAFIAYQLNSQNFEFNKAFDDRFGDYKNKYGTNRADHEFMGGYVEFMAYALKEWDRTFGDSGGLLGDDYYKALAFGGLVKDDGTPTDSFKQLVPKASERSRYLAVIINEATGNSNSKGKKCQ
jgi:hypothetical protein